MDNYIVSARKYRPRTFDSVVGQHALTTTLKNAIATGKLAHAYLFCGPRGVGKTTCARIFAKAINCMNRGENGEPCDHCESCRSFNENRSYNIMELDAASNNSVDDIRALVEQAQMPPQVGKYKVFIIDEVHMLSSGAFNAFLKTLEEPPAYDVFILATTEKHKLLPTIISRCQIYDFKRMEVPDIVNHLKYVAADAHVAYEEAALNVIAQKADGGMRDALSIFDQVVGFSGGNVTYAKVIEDLNVLDYEYYFGITDSLLKADVPAALLTFNEILAKGFSGQHFVSGLATHFRDLLVSREASTLPLLDVAESVRQRYQEQALRCKPRFLMSAIRICNDCDINYRAAGNKRLLVEIALIRTAQLNAPADEPPGSGLGPTPALKPLTAAASAAPTAPQHATPVAPAPANTATDVTAEPTKPYVATPSASAATTAPTTATPRTRPLSSRITTLSLNSIRESAATANAPSLAATPKQYGNKPYTLSDVRLSWRQFAESLPQEQRAMSERMKAMEPQGQDNEPAEVVAENELVLEQLNSLKPALLAFLRARLDNSHADIRFRVRAAEEKHRAYSQKEKFDAMLAKSEPLRTLRETLALELA